MGIKYDGSKACLVNGVEHLMAIITAVTGGDVKWFSGDGGWGADIVFEKRVLCVVKFSTSSWNTFRNNQAVDVKVVECELAERIKESLERAENVELEFCNFDINIEYKPSEDIASLFTGKKPMVNKTSKPTKPRRRSIVDNISPAKIYASVTVAIPVGVLAFLVYLIVTERP